MLQPNNILQCCYRYKKICMQMHVHVHPIQARQMPCGPCHLQQGRLRVSQPAVSRQVKTLEARLGVRLFEGPRHDLRLTAEGAAFATALTPAFDALTEAVRSIRRAGQVHLAIHPSLAVKWLIPRLADFHRRRPDVELHVQDLAPGAVKARGADLSVRIIDGEQDFVEVVTDLLD